MRDAADCVGRRNFALSSITWGKKALGRGSTGEKAQTRLSLSFHSLPHSLSLGSLSPPPSLSPLLALVGFPVLHLTLLSDQQTTTHHSNQPCATPSGLNLLLKGDSTQLTDNPQLTPDPVKRCPINTPLCFLFANHSCLICQPIPTLFTLLIRVRLNE